MSSVHLLVPPDLQARRLAKVPPMSRIIEDKSTKQTVAEIAREIGLVYRDGKVGTQVDFDRMRELWS